MPELVLVVVALVGSARSGSWPVAPAAMAGIGVIFGSTQAPPVAPDRRICHRMRNASPRGGAAASVAGIVGWIVVGRHAERARPMGLDHRLCWGNNDNVLLPSSRRSYLLFHAVRTELVSGAPLFPGVMRLVTLGFSDNERSSSLTHEASFSHYVRVFKTNEKLIYF
jgi:hypothetical protein